MTEHPQAPESGQPGNPEGHINSAQPSEGSPAATAQNPTEPLSSGHFAGNPGTTAPVATATAAHPTGQHPTAAYPTAAYVPPAAGSAFSAHPAPSASDERPSRRRGLTVPVLAALAVGALIGGASGAGISLLSRTDNASSATSSTTVPANLTVNNPANATTITAVAASASPSVVTISVSGSSGAGTGSGVILSADGNVLTNTHVVTLDGATANGTIQVQTNDGKLYSAKVVGTDPVSDLAVIKLDNASGLAVAKWADSSKLNVGDAAIAIGAPLGLSGTVTNGIVSALNRSITVASSAVPSAPSAPNSQPSPQQNPFDFWNFSTPGQQAAPSQGSGSVALSVIQTDAAINPGNSGGALLNSSGEIIGINVAIANAGSSASTTGSIGVGFALPSNLAKRVSSELIANGVATHGLLGASVADANGSKDGSSTLTAGALVDVVSPGGAAAQAGLSKGDVVTVFNGVPIKGSTDLTAQVRALPAGSKAKLTYVRNGNSTTVDVTLGSYKL